MSTDTPNVYLDNGDSTPVFREVVDAMIPYFTEKFGNPASLHKLGLEAEETMDEARASLAGSLGCKPEELYFTSGATEANNLALNGLRLERPDKKHVIVSPIEHSSVLNVVKRWQKEGWVELTELKVDGEGFVDPDSLREAIREDTLLVSIIHANNEIGVVQNLEELGAICREHNVPLHSDMVQTLGKIPFTLNELPVDLASFNAHKTHGPKGIGVMFVRKGLKVRRIFEGAPQEKGVRPGTENVPGAVGFAKAVELSLKNCDEATQKIEKLAARLKEGLLAIPHVRWNGPEIGPNRVPGNLNVTFRYIEGEAILMMMNMKGVFVSSGSACSSRSLVPSHVLTSIGLFHEEAHGSIRYTLSRLNTEEDVDYALEVTRETVDKLRAMTAFIPEEHSERESDHATTFYKKK